RFSTFGEGLAEVGVAAFRGVGRVLRAPGSSALSVVPSGGGGERTTPTAPSVVVPQQHTTIATAISAAHRLAGDAVSHQDLRWSPAPPRGALAPPGCPFTTRSVASRTTGTHEPNDPVSCQRHDRQQAHP